jgi:hypothetical protein
VSDWRDPAEAATVVAEFSWQLAVTSEYSGRAAVFREELQANGYCDIGRQATSEDTVRRLGKCYSEL